MTVRPTLQPTLFDLVEPSDIARVESAPPSGDDRVGSTSSHIPTASPPRPTTDHDTSDERPTKPPMPHADDIPPSPPVSPPGSPPAGPTSAPPTAPTFVVEVVRSARRKRTVGAQMLGGVLRVTVPSWMSRDEEERWVREMTRRYERAHRTGRIDLVARAATLARRFDLPRPAEVRWGGDMRTQWGSCTPDDRTIRLADRLADMPPWVLDYVLVHEMAHIAEPNHSPAFWELVNRYDKAERAIGYLMAKSNEPLDIPDLDDQARDSASTEN